MHGSHLAIKRSQSECLILGPKIVSPSPINKRGSRLGNTLARELYDNIPPRIEEFESEAEESFAPRFFKAKSCIFQSGTDSSNEWSSESGFSGFGAPGELESPPRDFNRNPFCQDGPVEGVTVDLPSRTSNPIVYDSKFRRNDQKGCGFPLYSLQTTGLRTSNL